jgi:excisionase family DNA binding protein
MKRMLTTKDCAARLNLSRAGVIRLCSEGKLRASKIGGWRIDPDDLEAFIVSRRPASRPETPDVLCEVLPLPNSPFG